jgi:hypothetical protein
MKKPFLCIMLVFCSWAIFAEPISFKITSYLISRKQSAGLYAKAELSIDDETQSWEIILYKKNGSEPDIIRLEEFNIVENNGVFKKVSIIEGGKTTGSDLFAYIPVFSDKIQIDLCNVRTEGVRRRLILSL